MAVIDHDHSYLEAEPVAAESKVGLRCVFSFVTFWLAFLTVVWAVHALIDKLF